MRGCMLGLHGSRLWHRKRNRQDRCSALHPLRPRLRNGASWRAGAGRVRTVGFLNSLLGLLMPSHCKIYEDREVLRRES
jgi:hypothetical protein